MKILTGKPNTFQVQEIDGKVYDYAPEELCGDMLKSPADLTPKEKLQVDREMWGEDLDELL